MTEEATDVQPEEVADAPTEEVTEVQQALHNIGLNSGAGLAELLDYHVALGRAAGVEEVLTRDSTLVSALHTFLEEDEGATLTQAEVRDLLTHRNDLREETQE